ncbi:MAG: TylF/MycF/NovP-related O-methyltransferase [Erythrobacter sp.]|uniref:TylF/MycF/NovP-related O-methyltransferase n=1 Tax=Erythrobacter sp. TaxID=1042 RepID=UPI0032EE3274
MPEESGNIIEYGSYSGGSAIFMALLLKEFHPGAQVYALDTFGSRPKTDKAVDMHESGKFGDANVGRIRSAADSLGLDNLHLVQGLVKDTAQSGYDEAGSFGLAHLDLDIYHPLKFAHETVRP